MCAGGGKAANTKLLCNLGAMELVEKEVPQAMVRAVAHTQLEVEEENIVNRLQRQLEEVMHKNRVLEKRLEKGKHQLSESETSEDEASLFHDHYASFMSKSMKAMHRSQLTYRQKQTPNKK